MSWKYPPVPPMPNSIQGPIIGDAIENMKEAAAVLAAWNGVSSKERCLDKIRVAETYLAIAKEKLEKL
jgi:hypothetical protein